MRIFLFLTHDTESIRSAIHNLPIPGRQMPVIMQLKDGRKLAGRVVAVHPEIHALSILVIKLFAPSGELLYEQLA